MTKSFNVQHSPMGAFASFTCGNFHTRGGLASQQGRPAGSNLFIGYQREREEIRLLPFFEAAKDNRSDFEVEAHGVDPSKAPPHRALKEEEFTRTLGWATDAWTSGPLTVKVWSPFFRIPDPEVAAEEELKRACCPAVFATLTLDNRQGKSWLKGFFAHDDGRMRDLEATSNGHLVGVANLRSHGFAARPRPGLASFMEFNLGDGALHAGERHFRLGHAGGLVLTAAPGAVEEIVIAIGFHDAGVVTTGIEATYWYSRYFRDLESVLNYALDNWDFYRGEAEARDRELEAARLNPEQKFLVAHATHSYYGSTEWLDRGGKPLWVVNEGEYEMINTFDLTVDQLFYELRFSPWTVRNELEFFVERYSYYDTIHRFGAGGGSRPGGLSFCHDQGLSNQFTPKSHSSYETRGLPAKCFSYMTHEQLTNWVCCAGAYLSRTGDRDFPQRHRGILADCLSSLLNRDDPDPAKRNGIMGWDSDRCGDGAEITTYDSLDASLGQARNNLYLAGKTWAAYVILEKLFGDLGDAALAKEAKAGARRCADSMVGFWDDKLGYIPAVFENGNASAIIPAIEGLVFPKYLGLKAALDFNGEYGRLLQTLKRHFQAVFKPGLCQFPDGGWKLSSTSNNSWMSKIAICQHVARTVLGLDFGEDQLKHDRAHADWQRLGAAYWACSDQMVSGKAYGSKYYPRIVTTILWLDEVGA